MPINRITNSVVQERTEGLWRRGRTVGHWKHALWRGKDEERPSIRALERATGYAETDRGKIVREYKSTYKTFLYNDGAGQGEAFSGHKIRRSRKFYGRRREIFSCSPAINKKAR
ncbi:MAG TPA: hypothetical protein DCZ04_01235 [Syntrophorhabdus aromaticivorans]|nr:hypothetical protein [Syntrophorhabdus aromaticivorans]